jgi:DNA-directed RNA polymerase specialized sigma24 family protein
MERVLSKEATVSEETEFRDLMGRVRGGDAGAAEQLVRTYEPSIRMVIRRRLTDPALRRLVDSIDIVQSVLGNFFVRAASGQFGLDSPQQLHKLLVTMALNKIRNLARRPPSQGIPNGCEPVAAGPSPSQVVSYEELLQKFRNRLSEEEQRLTSLRASGRSWSEIAAELHGNPDALRMKYTRTLARVMRELEMEA